jgi:two-component system phosphate regulon response regulator PhoB
LSIFTALFRRKAMNILLVDDEPDYRILMGRMLGLEGWKVTEAEDGEHALEILSHDSFDIVISDVYMPVMDGIKLHRAIRETPGRENLPFLFVSAYDDEHTRDSVKNPKAEGFLKKGAPFPELKAWVKWLTSPEDARSKFPPGQQSKTGNPPRKRDDRSGRTR